MVVSCPWLSPTHPDPRGAHLQLVAAALRPLIASGQQWGVIWDYASVYQPPRHNARRAEKLGDAEQSALNDALAGLATLFAHE